MKICFANEYENVKGGTIHISDFFSTQDYREVLEKEFIQRKNKNSRYSMGAFARDLHLTPSRLSEIFSGRDGLSRTSALAVATSLNLSPRETDFFCDLVECRHGRSLNQRKLAKIRLKKYQTNKEFVQLREDCFHIVSDWYHNALLEVLSLPQAKSEIPWLARSLGLSHVQTELALQRLLRLGLVCKEKNKWIPAEPNSTLEAESPSRAIRQYHRQVLQLAIRSIEEQDIDERDLRSLIFAFPTRKIKKAKEKIRQFISEFAELSQDKDEKDQVYCLNLQFFKLSNLQSSKDLQL